MNDVLESRLGGMLVSIYAIASIICAVASYVCSKEACSGLIVVPILPWAAILVSNLKLSVPWGTYPLFLLFNASLLYILGVGIEVLLRKFLQRFDTASQPKL